MENKNRRMWRQVLPSLANIVAGWASFAAFSDGMDCAFVKAKPMEFPMSNLEQHLSVYSQAMNFRTQRHQVLASNIANADTPHYKARDFSFESAMQNAMAGRGSDSIAMATTSGGHIRGGGSGGQAALQYRTETQSAVDGNTVDMDVERAQITDNALQYQIVSQFISEKIKGMRSALASTSG
ncbi:flagellar basal body rod protein FlgB [Quatrionicoccus australiensis]|uniref:flagellar basal body rod protein FlgB n=1 Tax=Quatrionicoccus australiensis TaxID=138118 RepID=UPI001CF8EF56|nr:flagellar basal body rod protein FlgB [Quatrionicoccus australiensis]